MNLNIDCYRPLLYQIEIEHPVIQAVGHAEMTLQERGSRENCNQ